MRIFELLITTKQYIMKTIITSNDFKIEFNGSNTYFVTDNNGDAWYVVNTLRKAKNKLNKILKLQGFN